MAHKAIATAFIAGVIFGVGLLVGGMTQPSKVVGFLDLFGHWDPSLAFVMGGAIGVFLPLHRMISRRSAPLFATSFAMPTRRDIDPPLLIGAALFGVGWGLAGYCPGPAITSLGSASSSAIIMVASMVAGFALKRVWDYLQGRRVSVVKHEKRQAMKVA